MADKTAWSEMEESISREETVLNVCRHMKNIAVKRRASNEETLKDFVYSACVSTVNQSNVREIYLRISSICISKFTFDA